MIPPKGSLVSWLIRTAPHVTGSFSPGFTLGFYLVDDHVCKKDPQPKPGVCLPGQANSGELCANGQGRKRKREKDVFPRLEFKIRCLQENSHS